MGKTAILLGASGLVGNEVLKQLLCEIDAAVAFRTKPSTMEQGKPMESLSGIFEKIKIFVRKPIAFEHPKLEQVVIEFDAIDNYCDLIKGDVLFCCIGTTIKTAGSKDSFKKVDYTYPLDFAKIAKQNGIEKFLLISSIGADKTSSNFYLKVKGEIEEALTKLNFKALIILRPSMLLGDRKEFRFGEAAGKVVMKLFSFAFIGKLKKYKAIEASTVASAMIQLSKLKTTGNSIVQSDEIQLMGSN